MKKYLKLLIKLTISTGLIYVVFSKVDFSQLRDNILSINPYYLPLIVVLFFINYLVSSIRWRSLILKNRDHVSVPYLTRLYFIGAFFNNFMPTSIGGDVYKILVLSKRIESRSHAFVSTFMERFTGIIALAFISITVFSLGLGKYFPLPLIWFVLAIYFGVIVLNFLSRHLSFADKVFSALREYKSHHGVLVFAMVTSLVVQIVAVLTQYFIFIGLGVGVPWQFVFLVLPLITIAGFFIPSLNGLGVQDALYIGFFGMLGVPEAVSLTASVVYHFLRLLISLLGGLFYVVEKGN